MNKTTRIIIRLVVLALVAWIIVTVMEKDRVPSSTESIKVGGAFMLTGPAALVGELQQNGATLAVETINANGGVNGRPIELVIQDSTLDPKVGISAYNNLKQQGIKLFMMDGSPIIAAVGKIVAADKNFTIAGGAYAYGYFDGDPHTCRISLTAKSVGPSMADLAVFRGYKKVAIFMANNEQGKSIADEFSKAFSAKGGTVVTTEFYDAAPGVGDYRTNVTKLKAVQANVDAIIFSNTLNTLVPMLDQMKSLGLTKPIVADPGTLDNPALKSNFAPIENVDFAGYDYGPLPSPTDSAAVTKFKEAYKAKYGVEPLYFAASHYDTMMIIAQAVKEVGEDPEKVSQYVSNLKDYKGITGSFTFDSDCEVSRPHVFYTIKNGKAVRVK